MGMVRYERKMKIKPGLEPGFICSDSPIGEARYSVATKEFYREREK